MLIYSPFLFCWRAFGASSWRDIYTWGVGVVPPKWAASELTASFFPKQTDYSPGHSHGYIETHQSTQYIHYHPVFLPFDKIHFVGCPLSTANRSPASHISIIIIPKGQLSQHAFHYTPFLASRGSRHSRISFVFDIGGTFTSCSYRSPQAEYSHLCILSSAGKSTGQMYALYSYRTNSDNPGSCPAQAYYKTSVLSLCIAVLW